MKLSTRRHLFKEGDDTFFVDLDPVGRTDPDKWWHWTLYREVLVPCDCAGMIGDACKDCGGLGERHGTPERLVAGQAPTQDAGIQEAKLWVDAHTVHLEGP